LDHNFVFDSLFSEISQYFVNDQVRQKNDFFPQTNIYRETKKLLHVDGICRLDLKSVFNKIYFVQHISSQFHLGQPQTKSKYIKSKIVRNPRSQISAPHDPDAWLPAFALLRILLPMELACLASERFLWLAEPFTMDEFEAALDLCNNSYESE
jgi:hypothetical protein